MMSQYQIGSDHQIVIDADPLIFQLAIDLSHGKIQPAAGVPMSINPVEQMDKKAQTKKYFYSGGNPNNIIYLHMR